MVTKLHLGVIALLLLLAGCQSNTASSSLYEQIGGQQTIDRIVDNFIRQIEYDPHIIEFFLESDIDRFRSKLSEHICAVSGGPCVYSGDSMQDVHAGMHITESDFNRTVDLLIDAMTEAGLSHPQQNKVLALFVPMRQQMIYR